MITENMIKAGIKALDWHSERLSPDNEHVTAIYEAMSDQKQKDAMKEYKAQSPKVGSPFSLCGVELMLDKDGKYNIL